MATIGPAPPLSHDKLAENHDEKAELRELAESFTKLREKVETALDTVGRGYDSLRSKSLTGAIDETLKGEDLQKMTSFLLKSKETLEKLEKYMKAVTYADLVQQSLFAKTEKEKQEARTKLGYTMMKDGSSKLIKLAREVGLLSEKVTAKEFLIWILGKGPVLVLEGLELPVTVFWMAIEPTEMGDATLSGATGRLIQEKQKECQELIHKGAPDDEVHGCMADLLALQRGELPQHHTTKKHSHVPGKHKPLRNKKPELPHGSIYHPLT